MLIKPSEQRTPAEKIHALQARVEELEAALRPFAVVYGKWVAWRIASPLANSGYLGIVGIPLQIEPYMAAAAALGEGGE